MAQFDFIGTWDDSWQIVEALLELEGLTLIHDRNYAEPSPWNLTELTTDTQHLLRERRRLFIWSDGFSLHPPVMNRIDPADGPSFYSINQMRGGPFLELDLPPCFFEAERLNLAAGSLSYMKSHFNPERNDWDAPSPALIDGYKSLIRLLKSRVVKRHQFHERIWAGKHALRELAENRAVLRGYGLD